MNTFRLMGWVVVLAGIAVSAPARIGENRIQHEQRYGRAEEDLAAPNSATLELNAMRTYRHRGWRLRVTFVNGLADRIEYWKGGIVSDADIAAIQKAEAGGGRWTRRVIAELANGTHLFGEIWENSNGRTLESRHLVVIVLSPAAAARERAAEEARRKPKPPPEF